MDCRSAAQLLERYAQLLELAGENPYKARAYATAAEKLAALDQQLDEALASGILGSIHGIGQGILATLTELTQTGTIAHLRELERRIPPGVVQLTELRSVGTKKARQLWQECGITSIDELERACRDHRLASYKGFTAQREAALLEAIAFWRSTQGRLQRHKAWRLYHELRAMLTEQPVIDVIAAGQLRRGEELISTLVLVVIADAPDSLAFPEGMSPIGHHHLRWTGAEIPVEFRLAQPSAAGTVLFEATGSDEFVAAATGNRCLPAFEHEEQVFEFLGLPYIPPELRIDAAALEQIRRNGVPSLITLADMRGLIHVHTTWSDGKNSVEEMALAAASLGFEYIVICDHSQSAAYAGGLSTERVRQQRAEIAALNAKGLGIRILHGIESDILPDGSLDYPDQVLAEFDVVVASVHSHLSLTAEEQTTRMRRAIANPWTTIVGHPTGRLLLRRAAYAVDVDALIADAAQTGTILEFNVNPYRLDLDWRYHRSASAQGVRFAIDPDAHSVEGIHELADGITVARHGGLSPRSVVNTLGVDEFLALVAAQRQRKHQLRMSA